MKNPFKRRIYPRRIWERVKVGKQGESGVYFRFDHTFWNFYWKPICPFWMDENGKPVKSKQFQWTKFTLGHSRPNKGKEMNEHSDVAFEPMDNQPDKAVVHSDGTISVPIVEGDTYIDGVRQPKRGEEIIFVQDEEPEAPVH